MLGQPALHKSPCLRLQVEADEEAALLQDGSPHERARFLWTGCGFAVLVLIGFSACAPLPLFRHAVAKPALLDPELAFVPIALPVMGAGGIHPTRLAGLSRRPVSLPMHRQAGSASVRHAGGSRARPGGFVSPGVKQRLPMASSEARSDTARMTGSKYVTSADAVYENPPPEPPITPKTRQLPREEWPAGVKFHRFIKNDDPTLGEYPSTVAGLSQTPVRYQGTRKGGTYKESSRVKFTSPHQVGKIHLAGDIESVNHDWKTLELLKSKKVDNPSFGAVEVKLPLNIAVDQSNFKRLGWVPSDVDYDQAEMDRRSRVVVSRVNGNSNAEKSGIQRGDIIRAVSMKEPEGGEKPWWGKVFQAQVPAPEQGMAVLDGLGPAEFSEVLKENKVQNVPTVVLVIERPIVVGDEDDDDFFGGFRVPAARQMEPSLVPIPIPVEPGPRDPGGLPFPPTNVWSPSQMGTVATRDRVAPALAPIPINPAPVIPGLLEDPMDLEWTTMGASSRSDPTANKEEAKKKKEKNNYRVNVGEALDSLQHELPYLLTFNEDTQQFSPINWQIYHEALVTEYKTIDPLAKRLLVPGQMFSREVDDEEAAVIIAKSLRENQKILQELQSFCFSFVDRRYITASTKMGVDKSTGAEIIESRWTVKLFMKRLQIPMWLAKILGLSEPLSPEGVVVADATSRFHLDADGRIYRHSIDRLNIRGVDLQGARNPLLDYWIAAGKPAGGLIPNQR